MKSKLVLKAVKEGGFPHMVGQNCSIYMLDEEGKKHHLPVTGFKIECNGRREPVKLTATMIVDEIDMEGLELDVAGSSMSVKGSVEVSEPSFDWDRYNGFEK